MAKNKQTKIHEKMLTIPGHKEKKMQIKTILRSHLAPVRLATIKNTNNNKCWQGCREKGTFIHCWWERKLLQPLQTVWRLLKKLKIDLPYDPAIPLLGIYPKECDSDYYSMLIAALFTIVKLWKQPRCPTTNECTKNEILLFAGKWMELMFTSS
jgi:hypothetical protein